MTHSTTSSWIEHSAPAALTQSISLEETKLPDFFAFSVTTIGCLLAVFLVWAAFTPVEETASATGEVVPSDYIQSIQHLEGGMVKQILVKEGELVEKAQPLVRLDPTNADADLGQMRAKQQALQLQAARLKNFSNGDTSQTLTPEENAILASMVASRDSQQKVLRDQIAQKQKELTALNATRSALEKNVTLMEKETEMNRQMAAQGAGSQLMVMTSERELNQMRGQLNETISQQSRARDAISEAQNRTTSLSADLKSEAMKNLGNVEAELAEVNKSIAKSASAADRTEIKSPVRGIVKGLDIHTIGAVIEPGKTLMEIVPVENKLEVEAMVAPSDIGQMKDGQPVKIKVSAYDFSRYGNVNGVLENISASTFQTEKKESFYKAKIKLEQNYVGSDASRNLILPGMTVQAGIITGEKTILQYLLKPLQVAKESAFHEH